MTTEILPSVNISQTISDLMDRYIRIEQAVQRLWPASLYGACSVCTKVCCRPHMAEDLLASAWLATVSKKVHGNWPVDNRVPEGTCPALGERGCILTAGKHPFCRQFSCDDILDAPTDGYALIAEMFLSGIMTQVCRLKKGMTLNELSWPRIEASAPLIARQIEEGEKAIALYEAYLQARTDSEKDAIILRMVIARPGTITGGVQSRLAAFGF